MSMIFVQQFTAFLLESSTLEAMVGIRVYGIKAVSGNRIQ